MRSWKIHIIRDSLKDMKRKVDEIKDIQEKLKEINDIIRGRDLSISGIDVYFKEVGQDSLNVDAWKRLLAYVEAQVVKLVLGLDCSDVLNRIQLDLEILKTPTMKDEIRFLLDKLSSDKEVRIKLCNLVSNLGAFSNVIKVLDHIIVIFSNIYNGAENKIIENCRNRLEKLISRTILKLDVKRLGDKTFSDELGLESLDEIVKRGIGSGALKLLSSIISDSPLTLHLEVHVRELNEMINSCTCLENGRELLNKLEKIIDSTYKTLLLLERFYKASGKLTSEGVYKLINRVKEAKSINSLTEILKEMKTIDVKALGKLWEILIAILKHMKGDRADISEIIESLPKENKSQYVEELIELCKRRFLACTVSMKD